MAVFLALCLILVRNTEGEKYLAENKVSLEFCCKLGSINLVGGMVGGGRFKICTLLNICSYLYRV